MQSSQQYRSRCMSSKLYNQPMQEFEAYCMPQFQTLDHQLRYNGSSQRTHLSIPNARDQYCTLESSSANGSYPIYNSPSTVSLSPNGSPVSQQESQSYPPDLHHSPDNNYGSPISGSCITDDVNDFRSKLRELETDLLGPDYGFMESIESNFQNGSSIKSPEMDIWRQMMEAISRGDLKHVLIACAKAVSDNDLLMAQWLMDELRQIVSVSGEPIQRLGAYMLEGLVARLASSGSSIYKSLRCKEPASADLLSYMHILYEVCPYFKFGYMSANGAIAEAMKDENKVHIIDFQIGQGSQWVTLIQAFAARPGGPPRIRITGIDDSTSAYARGGGPNIVGKRLAKLAESVKVPFEFHAAAMPNSEVHIKNLGVEPGEALAVNFAFMLHHLPDESVSTQNHRDRLLRLVKSLSPKVVTLVEQESNTNTAAFFPRFLETLNYYTAMFESIDVTLSREHKERINVEQHCLARDVVNIIACEGTERVERHELLGKWRSRFRMAGFTPYPLSSLVNSTIKILLENYCYKYRLEERDGALYLGWMNRDLVASCAWK
ncbi:scarecrow-like transcription factor PAT1 [Ricinus communis]|uniref:scarecrow-like transcription factor PAT1 n=1 Tax=Ricinus communis TaxID=3988 RepID=UPI0007725535|nr:scarecrow-like transcription factor PAT1 [Ricinus communis]XP_015583658.1 scarecrow-like transcription factor PAT1 [Ricinus communis]XP_015583660.1 scarecrow-like transcription factor PAT1 [Ricinus communis]XP_015583661.1 scarecrow-like transcription factor PAT1 [Ricinus communis]XP_015583662.1 scarecrow-like transcription factor PAT1 [Ricinus communis]XP_048232939.1 scarecrow-like transcription factor PAT1 [Ricinus communis]XP_048232940.1 scarecrow-like transcription factor PAT1 [Ricinus |eukprot:XP_015583657.1 scarecrow-like transcription factor PAT1 [Ricinus communis]